MRARPMALLPLLAILFLCQTWSPCQSTLAVTVPSMFGDSMVLQREAAVPVWGTAVSGAKVSISFAGRSVTVTADDSGDWRAELPAMGASSEPRTLSITSDKNEQSVKIEDVLVGDVWVGSGQSNMAGRVASYAKSDSTLAAIAERPLHPSIRLMQGGPQPKWVAANPQNVGQFSALLFAFGERLHRELDVPIGLILGAVGGTPSGYWIPAETFSGSERCKASIAEFAKTYDANAEEGQYLARLMAWERQAAAAKVAGKKPTGRKPQPPTGPGTSRRGGEIGNLYERFIEPVVGYRIRGVLWDQGEARSGVIGVDQYTMMSELIRGWRDAWEQGPFPFLFVQKPSGGGCALSGEDPITRNADPFVPLPQHVPADPRAAAGTIDRVMYVQLMQSNENAWMVPASDLGSGIHPTNKWGYGNRAAEVALAKVYQTGAQAYGPIYRSHRLEGNRVILSFDEVGKGLTAAHLDRLQGFAIAGGDGQWVWADAKIDGDEVVVWSDQVDNPKRVRYAFASKRAWANLFNQDGLPAIAFETKE